MKERVKFFSSDKLTNLEVVVNAWLKSEQMNHIQDIRVQQMLEPAVNRDYRSHEYVATITYTEF